jgi:hypothetical protein
VARTGTLRQEPSTNGSRAATRPRAETGITARTSARNRSRILLGLLIALVSAFAAAVLYADAGERHPVLAVTRPVAAGQIIEAGDLREVMVAVDGDLRTISADQKDRIVGRTASVPLAAGSILIPEQVGESTLLDPSQAVFGAVLGEGDYPVELRAGDSVLLYAMPATGEAASDVEAVRATVVSVGDGQSPGSVRVTFSAAPGDAGPAALAAAQDRLIAVLAPR